MTDRPRTTLAVYLLLRRADELLFIRRCNSGWQDGRLTLVAGHVDPDESARSAIVREAAEEVGIDLDPDDLELVHAMHRNGPDAYLDLYFSCRHWAGEPKIREPEKAVDLSWIPIDRLPVDVIETVRAAIKAIEARGTA